MISVKEARARILKLAPAPVVETVHLTEAAGRVLLKPLAANRDQPPFAASTMDGYAVRQADIADGAVLGVVGEAAAGKVWAGRLQKGEALRIFTGAPVPDGADCVVIQENVQREGNTITLGPDCGKSSNMRPAGADFAKGWVFEAKRRLNPQDIALLAAMNHAHVPVARKPVVALLPTGSELVNVGEVPQDAQIISSNNLGLKALVEAAGARARLLPIAPDTPEGLRACLALCEGADLVITLGGASVGDHDLVASVGQDAGLVLDFYKIAIRPGKPLMAGRLNGIPMLGLPGNPVSSMVCSHVFVLPLLRAMLGLPQAGPGREYPLAAPLPANGARSHYMRAGLVDGALHIRPRQDSGLLSVLAGSDILAIHPANSPALKAGDMLKTLDMTAYG
ncbi:MAG: molybdopterin molybdotransferase MoeA [Paracoccaceae bacterium]